MSKIYKKKSKLKEDSARSLYLQALSITALIAYVASYLFSRFRLPGLWALIPVVVLGGMASHFGKQRHILRSGVKGEEETLRMMKSLPDSYSVFPNVHVRGEEGSRELDLVVVGPNGVFVVEVKNHNGTIQGNADDQEWIQHKTGKGGGKYSSQMKNPLKQVSGQVYALSRNLKAINVNAWVEGLVFFSNNNVNLNVRGADKSVFSDGQKLRNRIERHACRNEPDQKSMKRITEFLRTRQ